jgi:hypothetical protein
MIFAQTANEYQGPAGGRRIPERKNPIEGHASCSQILGAMNRIMAEHFGVAGKDFFCPKPATDRSERIRSSRGSGTACKKERHHE